MKKSLTSFFPNSQHKVAVILGRMNPLHLGHKYKLIAPALQGHSFTSQTPETHLISILGSVNICDSKNPFSGSQREEMVMITTSELLQSQLRDSVSEENLAKLSDLKGIDLVIDRSSSFIYYRDSFPNELTNPPSLDRLKRSVEDHCEKHKISTSRLEFYSSVRSGEAGPEYKIDGVSYKNTAQLTAVAKSLGASYQEYPASQESEVISATRVRNNLVESFDCISPGIFRFIQNEMGLSILNKRLIGADKSSDKVTDASGFVGELAKQGRLLSFTPKGSAVVENVPPDRMADFMYYREIAVQNPEHETDKPRTDPNPSGKTQLSPRVRQK